MSFRVRLARHGRLAALIVALCPSVQDVITEALANTFTDHMPLAASGWLAVPLGLLSGVIVERLPGIANKLRRALEARLGPSQAIPSEPAPPAA
jgi:hypothetical protein